MDRSDDKQKDEQKRQEILEAGLAGAAADTVQRYGTAVKEHFAAYAGVDNETGQVLKKGLKQIAEEKINDNPAFERRNINQQAGFAAEVKTVARENAEKAIRRDTSRTVRTDDLPKQSDGAGHTIGGVNDPLYDIAEVNQNGVYIQGTGRQLKFVGTSSKACYKAIKNHDFDKYRNAGIEIEIPAEYYDDVQARLAEQAEKLQQQIHRLEADGETEALLKRKAELDQIQKSQRLLRKSDMTKEDAIFARTNPILSTGADIAKLAHRSGVEAAKTGAAIGGTVSIVKNLVSMVSGEKAPEEAVLDVAFETGGAAVLSYGTGFAGSAIKGAMQNAPRQAIRNLSKTNLPGVAVTVAVDAAKTMKRYFDGEIDGVECLEELGEQGTGMLVSGLFSAVGTSGAVAFATAASAPATAVGFAAIAGGLAGGMLGYAVASASYRVLTDALKEQKLAAEERRRIEAECAEQIELIRAYRLQLEQVIQEYLLEQATVFQSAFDDIKSAMALGDIDGFIAGANSISQAFGREAQFGTMEEFDALMGSDVPFTL